MNSKIIALGEKIHNAMCEYVIRIGHTDHWDFDLEGGCAVGAFFLMQEMKRKLGLKAEFIAAPNHSWVEYKNHIYDVTASQFGSTEKVFVLDKSKLDGPMTGFQFSQYRNSDRETIEYVNKIWPTIQRPCEYKLRWINQHKVRIDQINMSLHKGALT